MRKVIIELSPNEMAREVQDSVMEGIEEIEMLELLQLDLAHGEKMGVVRIRFQPGGSVPSLSKLGFMEVINVIEEKEGEAIVLVKARAPPGFKEIVQDFDAGLVLVWTAPMKVTRDRIVYSFIGDENSIRKVIAFLRVIGETVKISLQEASFNGEDILSSLTDKQKEMLKEAKRIGYYDYPRAASATDLAKSVGRSRSTVVEHLRKAEIRLLNRVLEGH